MPWALFLFVFFAFFAFFAFFVFFAFFFFFAVRHVLPFFGLRHVLLFFLPVSCFTPSLSEVTRRQVSRAMTSSSSVGMT